jgi:hypothetical protein
MVTALRRLTAASRVPTLQGEIKQAQNCVYQRGAPASISVPSAEFARTYTRRTIYAIL